MIYNLDKAYDLMWERHRKMDRIYDLMFAKNGRYVTLDKGYNVRYRPLEA